MGYLATISIIILLFAQPNQLNSYTYGNIDKVGSSVTFGTIFPHREYLAYV